MQAAKLEDEKVRYRYLDPTSRKKPLTAVVELEKGWKRLRRRVTLKEDQPSQLIWIPEISDTGPPNRQHAPADMRPPTHTQ